MSDLIHTPMAVLFLTVMEIFIVFIEGWLLKNLIPRLSEKSFKYSLYLNGISYLFSYIFWFIPMLFISIYGFM